MRLVALAGMALAAALAFGFARSAPEARACGVFGPFDFDTYESEDYITEYGQAIHVAAEGMAGLPTYLVNGEPVDLAYQGLETGPRGDRNGELNAAIRIPPTIFKSIAWIEANWSNASGLVPFGGAGPALVSPDCGYGLGQITSGMANTTGTASARQAAIGTHPLFNLAEGARILADKWNAAPNFRPIAGNGDPAAVEDWYYAIWSYNGFAFSNHPLNPNRDPLRAGDADSPIYHCFDPQAPSYQGALYGYGDYTYPERVYGCMRHPPQRDGQLLWEPQTFRMPDFGLEIISTAFAPSNFLDCEEGGFSGGCPAMDFATTIDIGEPELLTPHADTTGPANPAWRAKWLGDPVFSYSGPASLPLTAFTDGSATSGVVRVRNVGVGIGPFRIRTSHPWIVVRHDNDQFPRRLDGSVAVGSEIEVVLQKATESQPRIAQAGWESVLRITLDTAAMPPGLTVGAVYLEPLLGSGGVFTVDITA
ncbi:MAG: hypothetical protein ACRDHF_14870, partial [Tepidiformaceae bacterium]